MFGRNPVFRSFSLGGSKLRRSFSRFFRTFSLSFFYPYQCQMFAGSGGRWSWDSPHAAETYSRIWLGNGLGERSKVIHFVPHAHVHTHTHACTHTHTHTRISIVLFYLIPKQMSQQHYFFRAAFGNVFFEGRLLGIQMQRARYRHRTFPVELRTSAFWF